MERSKPFSIPLICHALVPNTIHPSRMDQVVPLRPLARALCLLHTSTTSGHGTMNPIRKFNVKKERKRKRTVKGHHLLPERYPRRPRCSSCTLWRLLRSDLQPQSHVHIVLPAGHEPINDNNRLISVFIDPNEHPLPIDAVDLDLQAFR